MDLLDPGADRGLQPWQHPAAPWGESEACGVGSESCMAAQVRLLPLLPEARTAQAWRRIRLLLLSLPGAQGSARRRQAPHPHTHTLQLQQLN